jgi:hypothetical protein
MLQDGDIEIACPRCGHRSIVQFSEIQEDFVCAGCARPVALDPKQISNAIKQGQRALNETIRGLKRRPR